MCDFLHERGCVWLCGWRRNNDKVFCLPFHMTIYQPAYTSDRMWCMSLNWIRSGLCASGILFMCSICRPGLFIREWRCIDLERQHQPWFIVIPCLLTMSNTMPYVMHNAVHVIVTFSYYIQIQSTRTKISFSVGTHIGVAQLSIQRRTQSMFILTMC